MPADKPLRYHLRFQILPGARVEADARALARFCKAHGVEEVVLFFAAEEWNNGLLSAADEDRWFDALSRAVPILRKAGVVCSLNPWMTTLHCARGRRFPADRAFAPMVSPLGEVSQACASFACPSWREYVYNLYGRFAKLGFRVLWVEDDFRIHNHGPLTWGGGFEPLVIERFEKKIGRKTSREEVLAAITQPGGPHPWRALWMETWREMQLEVAAGLSAAVAANAPGGSKLGLMSSSPATHSIEGRDWQKLFAALSVNGQVAHRPHYAGYSESVGRGHFYCIAMLDAQRAFRPAGCEVAPELENFPFTRWTKSDAQTWTQMAVALLFGSDAILLDIFPFSANPADREPEIGEMLDRSRPGLEWIAARFTPDLATSGVGLPWKQDAQAHVRTRAAGDLKALDADFLAAGAWLLSYGVPTACRRQPVNAVFGSLAWAFSDGEWREMLAGGVMLDGVSADVLCQRGFGDLIGVDMTAWLERERSTYAIERVAAKECGAPLGHCFNMNLLPRVAALEPRPDAVEWTTLITPEEKRIGAATVVFANKLGGRVFVHAAPNPAQLPMDYHRQRIVQSAVRFAAGKAPLPLVTGGPHLMPMHFAGESREYFVVYNGGVDPAAPAIEWPGRTAPAVKATLLAPLAKPKAAKVTVAKTRGGHDIASQAAVPYHGYLVLEICSSAKS